MATSLPETLLLVVQILTPFDTIEKQSLLAACTRAFEGGSCLEGPSKEQKEGLQASVEFTSSEHVILEVKLHGSSQQFYSSREISFQPEDHSMDRARSIGLSLGVLASALQEQQRGELSLKVEPSNAPRKKAIKKSAAKALPTQTHAPPPTRERLLLGLAAGIDFNPSWQGVAPSVEAHGGYFATPLLLVLGRFTAAYQPGPSERTTLRYLSPSLGAGVRLPLGSASLVLSAEGGLELVTGFLPKDSSDGDGSERVEENGRWVGIGRVGTELLLPLTPSWQLSLAPAVTFNLTSTEYYVDGISHGSTGNLRLSLRAGITWLH